MVLSDQHLRQLMVVMLSVHWYSSGHVPDVPGHQADGNVFLFETETPLLFGTPVSQCSSSVSLGGKIRHLYSKEYVRQVKHMCSQNATADARQCSVW